MALKLWKKDELRRENLDFSFTDDLQLPEVVKVWYWELDRELGTVNEPFKAQLPPLNSMAKCPPGHDPRHQIALPLGLKYRRLCELLRDIKPNTDSLQVHMAPYSTIHAFEIDWTVPLKEITKAFKSWLEAQTVHQRWGNLHCVPLAIERHGRKDFCDAWLRELAVYRICCARLKYKEGMNLLRELGITKADIGSSNWSHAKFRSRERIRAYKELVESLRGWRDRVMSDSTLAWNMLKSFSRASIDGVHRRRRRLKK
jgi:hypothetical protein